jgi:hypothetical protein
VKPPKKIQKWEKLRICRALEANNVSIMEFKSSTMNSQTLNTMNMSTMSSMSKSRTRNSVMQVASLKPEFEFEVIKLVLLRESYIQRVQRKLDSNNGSVDMSIIGLFDILRDSSIDIVETIRKWERTQVDYPNVKPFTWNGRNYLMKMIDDLIFLADYPKVRSWLGFELRNNVFLVPPELLLPAVTVPEDSYLVFGSRPDPALSEVKKPKPVKALKSPYLTPIINDVNVFPTLSKAAKVEKAEKKRGAASGVVPSAEVVALRDKANADPFETFLSSDMMMKIRKCWEVLCSRKANLMENTLSMSFSNFQLFDGSTYSTQLGMNESSMVSELQHTFEGMVDENSRHSSQAYVISSSISEDYVKEKEQDDGVSQTSRVKDPYHQFQENMAIAGRLSPQRHNQSYRISSLDDYGKAKTGLGSLKSHVWTPHEINLQRVVQKKGGELFVLTAAGTQGRQLAPWRKSRFERLTDDFEHVKEQHENLCMEIEEAESYVLNAQDRLERAKRKLEKDLAAAVAAQLVGLHLSSKGMATPPPTQRGLTVKGVLTPLQTERGPEETHSQLSAPPSSSVQDLSSQPRSRTMSVSGVPPAPGMSPAPAGADSVSRKLSQAKIEAMSGRPPSSVSKRKTSSRPSSGVVGAASSRRPSKVVAVPHPLTDPKPDQAAQAASVAAAKEAADKAANEVQNEEDTEPDIKLPQNDLIRIVPREISASANLAEVKFHIETQRKLMQYQLDYFKKIVEGSVSGVEKLRKMRRLDEGVALDTDEKLAMSLEDTMATKIQRKIRYKYGKLIRKAMFIRQTAAATKIQTVWRRVNRAVKALRRARGFNLALKMQTLFRGRRGIQAGTELKLMTMQQASIRLIQRVYRGYRGRIRTLLKAEFLAKIDEAILKSSFVELSPGDIDDLADVVQDFVNDFELNLPTAVLNTLRGVMYMFNGDKPEKISVDIENGGGFMDLRARSLNWDHARLFLRRKGKFLRRLRSLARQAKLPDARRFDFSDDCVAHLKILCENTQESIFYPMRKGRRAIVTIFRYTAALQRVQELQHHFPEYFQPGQPNWYRRLVSLRLKYEQAEIGALIEIGCESRLEELRQEIIKAGKKFGFVAQATARCKAALASCRADKLAAKKKLDFAVEQLELAVQKKIVVMENLRTTRELGLQVAQNELRLYREIAIAIDTRKLKVMYRDIDKRSLDLLDTKSSIHISKQGIELDREARDFDRSLKFDKVHQKCVDIGRYKAELMVIAESWKSFLDKIGGSQFLPDLIGDQRDYYLKTRADVTALMRKRRDAVAYVSKGVKSGFDRALKHAQTAKQRFLAEHPWDSCSEIEAEYEMNEDLEWAKRDADSVIQDSKLATQVEIPDAEFSPVLVLADLRLPAEAQKSLMERLKPHNVECVPIPHGGLNTDLMVAIQALFDARKNVVIFIDRGVNRVARGKFIASFNALVSGLIPNPRVIAVDASDNFTTHVWHGRLRLNQEKIAGEDILKVTRGKQLPEHYESIVMLGKLRLISSMIKYGIRHYYEYEQSHSRPQTGNGEVEDTSGAAGVVSPKGDVIMSPWGSPTPQSPLGPHHPEEQQSVVGSVVQQAARLTGIGSWLTGTATRLTMMSKSSSEASSGASGTLSALLAGGNKPAPPPGSGRRRSGESKNRTMTPVREGETDADSSSSSRNEETPTDQEGTLEQSGEQDGSGAHNNDQLQPLLEENTQITDDGDYEDSEHPSNGDFAISSDFPYYPDWLCMRFIADLNSLYESLRADTIEDHRYLTILTAHLSHDKLVAAMVSSVLGLWTAPVTKWTDAQINVGCLAFLQHLGTPEALCHMLAVRHMPDCGMFSIRRVEEAIRIAHTWGNRISISLYSHPVRFLLLQWCFSIAHMMRKIAYQGGEVQHSFVNTRVHHCRYVDWDADILSGDTDGIVGDVLNSGLHPYLVYEHHHCPVIISYLCNNYEDTERQVIESRQEFHPVQVFYCGKIVYVCVQMTKVSGHKVRYFASAEMTEVLRIFNPNGIEVFEGKVKKYRIGKDEFDDRNEPRDLWYELLAQWCRIDFTGEHPTCHLLRARSLMFSRISLICGYHVRVEVFEERHGEIVIAIHNLLPSGASAVYRVNRETMHILSQCADHFEEKGKLQVNDYNSIAGIICDRLKFKPHNRTRMLMAQSDLLPTSLPDADTKHTRVTVGIRQLGGPGRLVGRKYVKFPGFSLKHTLHLIITMYDISSDSSDNSGLRIIIYEQSGAQSVEYRLSALERLILFPSDEQSIVDQFAKRLKACYCDTKEHRNNSKHGRALLLLNDDYKPTRAPFVVDGTQEYDIQSPFEVYPMHGTSVYTQEDFTTMINNNSSSVLGEPSAKSIGAMSNKDNMENKGNNKDKKDNNADLSANMGAMFDIKLSSKQTNTKGNLAQSQKDGANNNNNNNTMARQGSFENDDNVSDDSDFNHKAKAEKFNEHSSLRDILESNAMGECMGWAIYFNRTIVEHTRGNLQFSMCLNSTQHGFSVLIHDVRTHREAFRFVSYKEAARIMYDKTEDSLVEEGRCVDESNVYDLCDELLTMLNVQTDENGNSVYCLVSDKQPDDSNSSSDDGNGDEHTTSSTMTAIPLCYVRTHEIVDLNEDYDMDTHTCYRIVVPPASDDPQAIMTRKSIHVSVHGAKGLQRIGAFGSRNPFAIVWWNKHEIGRTDVCAKSNNPKWDKGNEFVGNYSILDGSHDGEHHDKNREFYTKFGELNSLEIEVWDTPKRAFLGVCLLTGNDLLNLILANKHTQTGTHKGDVANTGMCKQIRTMELIHTYKLDKVGNAHVQGKLTFSLTVERDLVDAIASAHPELAHTHAMNFKMQASMLDTHTGGGGGGADTMGSTKSKRTTGSSKFFDALTLGSASSSSKKGGGGGSSTWGRLSLTTGRSRQQSQTIPQQGDEVSVSVSMNASARGDVGGGDDVSVGSDTQRSHTDAHSQPHTHGHSHGHAHDLRMSSIDEGDGGESVVAASDVDSSFENSVVDAAHTHGQTHTTAHTGTHTTDKHISSTLFLTIAQANNLPACKLIVQLNNSDVCELMLADSTNTQAVLSKQASTLTSAQTSTQTSTRANTQFNDPHASINVYTHLTIPIPAPWTIDECSLRFQLWDTAYTQLLGSQELCGHTLTQMIASDTHTKELTWIDFDSSTIPKRVHTQTMMYAPMSVCGRVSVGGVVCADTQMSVCTQPSATYTLDLLSVHNLCGAELKAISRPTSGRPQSGKHTSTHPHTRGANAAAAVQARTQPLRHLRADMYFNHELIGSADAYATTHTAEADDVFVFDPTNTQSQSQSQSQVELKVSQARPAVCSLLEVRYVDVDEGDLVLGSYVCAGRHLVHLLEDCDAREEERKKRAHTHPHGQSSVHTSTKQAADTNTQPGVDTHTDTQVQADTQLQADTQQADIQQPEDAEEAEEEEVDESIKCRIIYAPGNKFVDHTQLSRSRPGSAHTQRTHKRQGGGAGGGRARSRTGDSSDLHPQLEDEMEGEGEIEDEIEGVAKEQAAADTQEIVDDADRVRSVSVQSQHTQFTQNTQQTQQTQQTHASTKASTPGNVSVKSAHTQQTPNTHISTSSKQQQPIDKPNTPGNVSAAASVKSVHTHTSSSSTKQTPTPAAAEQADKTQPEAAEVRVDTTPYALILCRRTDTVFTDMLPSVHTHHMHTHRRHHDEHTHGQTHTAHTQQTPMSPESAATHTMALPAQAVEVSVCGVRILNYTTTAAVKLAKYVLVSFVCMF